MELFVYFPHNRCTSCSTFFLKLPFPPPTSRVREPTSRPFDLTLTDSDASERISRFQLLIEVRCSPRNWITSSHSIKLKRDVRSHAASNVSRHFQSRSVQRFVIVSMFFRRGETFHGAINKKKQRKSRSRKKAATKDGLKLFACQSETRFGSVRFASFVSKVFFLCSIARAFPASNPSNSTHLWFMLKQSSSRLSAGVVIRIDCESLKCQVRPDKWYRPVTSGNKAEKQSEWEKVFHLLQLSEMT